MRTEISQWDPLNVVSYIPCNSAETIEKKFSYESEHLPRVSRSVFAVAKTRASLARETPRRVANEDLTRNVAKHELV